MKSLFLSLALLAAPALAAEPAAPHPGEKVYREVCQACHMANAKGAEGAGRITGLAGNANLAYPEYPIGVVTGGKGPMPWFRGQLTDQQIADVIGYVRTHFGNKYKGKVSAAMVAESGVPAPPPDERQLTLSPLWGERIAPLRERGGGPPEATRATPTPPPH